jgi:hypothetical protein
MGHHGSEEPSAEMLRAMESLKNAASEEKSSLAEKIAAAESPKFGATGKFPMGELDKSDEGEIAFGVASHRGKVIINFGKPVAWLGMDARQAASLAALLIQHANRCRDIGNGIGESAARANEHAT